MRCSGAFRKGGAHFFGFAAGGAAIGISLKCACAWEARQIGLPCACIASYLSLPGNEQPL